MNAEVEENTLGVGPHPRKSSELHYCTHTVGVLPYRRGWAAQRPNRAHEGAAKKRGAEEAATTSTRYRPFLQAATSPCHLTL